MLLLRSRQIKSPEFCAVDHQRYNLKVRNSFESRTARQKATLMEFSKGNLIFDQSTCICSSVHTVTVHHRNFPELAVEATTPARAVTQLEYLL